MGELGEIGWYLKLEAVADKSKNLNKKDKDKERIKQPLFQFRYNPHNGKFIRELKESLLVDNASKDPNFINGKWQNMISQNHH